MHQFGGLPGVETLHAFLISLFCFIFCLYYRLYTIALYNIELYCIVLFYFPVKKKKFYMQLAIKSISSSKSNLLV